MHLWIGSLIAIVMAAVSAGGAIISTGGKELSEPLIQAVKKKFPGTDSKTDISSSLQTWFSALHDLSKSLSEKLAEKSKTLLDKSKEQQK